MNLDYVSIGRNPPEEVNAIPKGAYPRADFPDLRLATGRN